MSSDANATLPALLSREERKPARAPMLILEREDAGLKTRAHVPRAPDRLFRQIGVQRFARCLLEERHPPREMRGLDRQMNMRRIGMARIAAVPSKVRDQKS